MRAPITLLCLFVFAVAMFIQPGRAYAYLDPGSITMFFQLLIGAIAGGIVYVGVYWTRLKGNITTRLKTVRKRISN